MDVDFGSLIDQGASAGAQSAASSVASSAALKNLAGAMATGAAVGAALGTVIPGLGNIVGGVVGSVAGAVAGLAPLVAHALSGQCTITIDGLDSDCRDYPEHVAVAAKWLHEHPDAALHLTPAAFSRQAHILEQDFGEWVTSRGADYRERIHDSEAWEQLSKLPGARTLLRLAQVPAAAAIAGASPGQVSQLRGVLPRSFPALLPHDVDAISAKTTDLYQRQVAAASTWVQSQPAPPSPDDVRAHFPNLSPADVASLARPAASAPKPAPPAARARAIARPVVAPTPDPSTSSSGAPVPAPSREVAGKLAGSRGGGVVLVAVGLGVVALAGIAFAVAARAAREAETPPLPSPSKGQSDEQQPLAT